MKRCFISLVIRDMRIKTTVNYDPTSMLEWPLSKMRQQVLAWMEEKEPSCTVGRERV